MVLCGASRLGMQALRGLPSRTPHNIRLNIIAGLVVAVGYPILTAIPEAAEVVVGARLFALDLLDERGRQLPRVASQAQRLDAQRLDDEVLLLVDQLGEIDQALGAEPVRPNVNVQAAAQIDFGSCCADRAYNVLKRAEVLVAEDGADDLSAPLLAEAAVAHGLPETPVGGANRPGIARSDRRAAAHHRLDSAGDQFAGLANRLDLDAVGEVFHGSLSVGSRRGYRASPGPRSWAAERAEIATSPNTIDP